MKRTIFMLGIMMFLITNIAYAKPIKYKFRGHATGSVDSAVFSNAEVTISVSGNTDNVFFDGVSYFHVISSSAMIEIAGMGTGTLTREISVFNLQASRHSFAGLQQDSMDIVLIDSPELAVYDLQTSIGPLPYGYLSSGGVLDIETTMGTVLFDNSGDFTFQAEVQDDECMDNDNDGIEDCVDDCPGEDSTGLDADNDGCVDSFSGLTDSLQIFFAEGLIDSRLENSLTGKVMNAQAKADRDNICAAVHKLENSFMGELNAQMGKKIFPETAEYLIEYTNNVIEQLLDLLPIDEGC